MSNLSLSTRILGITEPFLRISMLLIAIDLILHKGGDVSLRVIMEVASYNQIFLFLLIPSIGLV